MANGMKQGAYVLKDIIDAKIVMLCGFDDFLQGAFGSSSRLLLRWQKLF